MSAAWCTSIERQIEYECSDWLNMKTLAFSSFCRNETPCVAFIRSIKHYFLMDKGDFFVHFMDLTEEELKKPVDDIVPPRLEALLELALRMSTANTDPFKDDLKVGSDIEPLQVKVIICQLNHTVSRMCLRIWFTCSLLLSLVRDSICPQQRGYWWDSPES